MSHEPSVDQSVGSRVARERGRVGLSRNELAARVSLSEEELAEVETGALRPDAGALLDIANALDVPVTTLLGHSEG